MSADADNTHAVPSSRGQHIQHPRQNRVAEAGCAGAAEFIGQQVRQGCGHLGDPFQQVRFIQLCLGDEATPLANSSSHVRPCLR